MFRSVASTKPSRRGSGWPPTTAAAPAPVPAPAPAARKTVAARRRWRPLASQRADEKRSRSNDASDARDNQHAIRLVEWLATGLCVDCRLWWWPLCALPGANLVYAPAAVVEALVKWLRVCAPPPRAAAEAHHHCKRWPKEQYGRHGGWQLSTHGRTHSLGRHLCRVQPPSMLDAPPSTSVRTTRTHSTGAARKTTRRRRRLFAVFATAYDAAVWRRPYTAGPASVVDAISRLLCAASSGSRRCSTLPSASGRSTVQFLDRRRGGATRRCVPPPPLVSSPEHLMTSSTANQHPESPRPAFCATVSPIVASSTRHFMCFVFGGNSFLSPCRTTLLAAWNELHWLGSTFYYSRSTYIGFPCCSPSDFSIHCALRSSILFHAIHVLVSVSLPSTSVWWRVILVSFVDNVYFLPKTTRLQMDTGSKLQRPLWVVS